MMRANWSSVELSGAGLEQPSSFRSILASWCNTYETITKPVSTPILRLLTEPSDRFEMTELIIGSLAYASVTYLL